MRCIGTHSSNVTWYLGHSVPLQAQLRRGWKVTGAQQLLKIRYQQSVKGLRWLICLFFSNFFIWLDFLSLISKLFSEYPARYWLILCPHTSENTLSTGHTVKAVVMYAITILTLPACLVLLQSAAWKAAVLAKITCCVLKSQKLICLSCIVAMDFLASQ